MNTFAEPLENIFRINKREGHPDKRSLRKQIARSRKTCLVAPIHLRRWRHPILTHYCSCIFQQRSVDGSRTPTYILTPLLANNQPLRDRRTQIINLPNIPSLPNLIGQFLINQQRFDVHFDEHGLRMACSRAYRTRDNVDMCAETVSTFVTATTLSALGATQTRFAPKQFFSDGL